MPKIKTRGDSNQFLNRPEYFKNRADQIRRKIDSISRDSNHDLDSLLSELTEKQAYFLDKADHFENSKSILADSDDAIPRLKTKIERLRYLSHYFQSINKNFKILGNPGDVRLTPYWENQIKTNLETHGIPFPPLYFSRIRRKIKFSSDRVKAIENASKIQNCVVNGVSIGISHGRIIVAIPWKPDSDLKYRLKTEFRLKWSFRMKCWVRKYTGQTQAWFDDLRMIFQNGSKEATKP